MPRIEMTQTNEKAGRATQLATAAHNIKRLARLERIRRALAAQNVPMLYLKGAAFLDTLYPELGTRPMADVDVLAQEEHLDAIDGVLRDHGLRTGDLADRPVTNDTFYERVYTDDAHPPLVLEVHRSFCQVERYNIDYPGVWQRSVTYQTQHGDVPTLSPEDSLLYVALHQGLHSFIIDHRSTEDLRTIVDVWRPHWPTVVERARRWGMATNLYASLQAAQHRGADVPAWVSADLHPGLIRGLALRALVDTHGTGRSRFRHWSRGPQLLSTLVFIERPRNLARFFTAYGWLRAQDWLAARRSLGD